MREIKLHNDTYDVNISYIFGGTIPELQLLLKKRHGEKAQIRSGDSIGSIEDTLEDDTDGYQFCYSAPLGENERYYVWAHECSHELIAHESSHLAYDILGSRGITKCDESEEAYAYMQGWLHKKLYKALGHGTHIKI